MRNRLLSLKLLSVLIVCIAAFCAPSISHAQDLSATNARLASVLSRGLDRLIPTERGAIRVISFGQSKAKQGAIFFIHGDPEWHRIGAFSQSLRDEQDKVLANHLEWLRNSAAKGKYAVYFVARTGMFGSDGETSEFRHEDAYLSISRAIEHVIAKDNITAAAIVGHSGGAAVALYHAIRLPSANVPCYALASGVYNIGAMAEFVGLQKTKDFDITRIDRRKFSAIAFAPLPSEMSAKLKYFEPLFHIGEIPKDPARHILAVAHRRDAVAPFFASEDLIERLNTLGHRARLVEGAAKPPTYHFTYDPAIETAASCLASAKRP